MPAADCERDPPARAGRVATRAPPAAFAGDLQRGEDPLRLRPRSRARRRAAAVSRGRRDYCGHPGDYWMSDVAQIRDQALEVAAGWSPPDGPDSWRLTAALFRLIAGHEALLAGLVGLPDDRLPALLASA